MTAINKEWEGNGLPPVGINVMCANINDYDKHTLEGEVVFSNNKQVVVNIGSLEVFDMGQVSPVQALSREDKLINQACSDAFTLGDECYSSDRSAATQMIRANYRKVSPQSVMHLDWIYSRMIEVHNEHSNRDYMIKFKSIIESLK